MRSFIVLCLVAYACADKLGYNYQPVGHSDAGLSFSPGVDAGANGGSFNLGDATNSEPSYAAPSSFGSSSPSFGASSPSFGSADASPSFAASPSDDSGAFASPSSGSPSYSAAPAAELNKEFFTYSANDDDFSDPAESQQVSNSLKQGLRVVFIKGPENSGLENAALNLAKHASEDQTAIYVLQKQADIGDLANKLNAARSSENSKPEVHFVKYRTPEDAANAQKAIQGQYDNLGGPSQSHDGGVAPVHNFASAAPARAQAPAQAPGAAYLPTNIFRQRF